MVNLKQGEAPHDTPRFDLELTLDEFRLIVALVPEIPLPPSLAVDSISASAGEVDTALRTQSAIDS